MVSVIFPGCDQRVKTLSLFSPPVNNLSVEMLQDKASDQYLNSLTTMRWRLPGKLTSLRGVFTGVHFPQGYI